MRALLALRAIGPTDGPVERTRTEAPMHPTCSLTQVLRFRRTQIPGLTRTDATSHCRYCTSEGRHVETYRPTTNGSHSLAQTTFRRASGTRSSATRMAHSSLGRPFATCSTGSRRRRRRPPAPGRQAIRSAIHGGAGSIRCRGPERRRGCCEGGRNRLTDPATGLRVRAARIWPG